MPPTLALLLTLGFIAFLFWRDIRQNERVATKALWLPFLWIFIIASRPVSWWLNTLGLPVHGAAAVEEGSTVDSIFYFVLIAGGICVLSRRNLNVFHVVHSNTWLTLFLIYCFIAVFWSDFPLVSFKRWIKVLGHPIMVLVLLTEPDPTESLMRIVKRCAYFVFPISILWIKYYPALGRTASDWGGMSNAGITGSKNALGALCLLLMLPLLWHSLSVVQRPKTLGRRRELQLMFALLLMIGYCLWKANSATSLIALVVSVGVMLFLSAPVVNRRRIVGYTVAIIAVAVAAQATFDVYGTIVGMTGHDSTLEGRSRLWGVLLSSDTSPILGTGFESYWLGERLQRIWALPEFPWQPTQAHNGYLELYINLGGVGLLIFLGLLGAVFWKGRQELWEDSQWGILTISCLVAILIHNWTEAGFKGLSLIYLFFFIVAIKHPRSATSAAAWVSRATDAESETATIKYADDDFAEPGAEPVMWRS